MIVIAFFGADGSYICVEHSITYREVESLCCIPSTNVTLCVDCWKERKKERKKERLGRIVFSGSEDNYTWISELQEFFSYILELCDYVISVF